VLKVTLKNQKEMVEITFDRERPFLEIHSYEKHNSSTQSEDIAFSFQYEITYKNGNHSSGGVGVSVFWKPKIIDIREAISVKIGFELQNAEYDGFTIDVYYELMEKLDISMPTGGFDNELDDPRNIKILFSAPFGQGKSTFLGQYFDERADKYNVFKLFPVNYSVASNQDIFRYIKSDILFQLLSRHDTQFEKITSGFTDSFYGFFKSNKKKVLSPFLSMIPKIGKNLHTIYSELNSLNEAFCKHQINKDELKKTSEFVQNLIEEEGSIYEDNFYSQLIRNLLSQLKHNDTKKENVLLIDDLDRMDPDHIFRILNVLSAHYDIFHNNTEEESNKFGFDRIILVGDYENLRHIYEYRYGPKVDFAGYINKYFSTGIFRFNNNEIFDGFIQNLDNFKLGDEQLKNPCYSIIQQMLKVFKDSNDLNLRELIKLREIGYTKALRRIRECNYDEYSLFNYSAFSPFIALLSMIGSHEDLKYKILKLNHESIKKHIKLDKACLQLFASLSKESKSTGIVCFRGDRKFVFDIQLDINYDTIAVTHFTIISSETLKEMPGAKLDFTPDDFIELLNKNIDLFNSIKHNY
jgi:hypothetical protein